MVEQLGVILYYLWYMMLHSIMISFSWYSAFFLMDDHSRELSVEHGDLSRDRKFKEVNRWLPLETLWRLKTGHLNCDGKDIPRKCEHLEIGLYIVRCLKVGWGSKCDSSHLWRRTLRSGVQKSRKLEISLNAYIPTCCHGFHINIDLNFFKAVLEALRQSSESRQWEKVAGNFPWSENAFF